MNLSSVSVCNERDILPEYRETAVGDLLAYHNLGAPHRHHTDAALLIGMCMDHRLQLEIPPNFAFVLRCAGANLGMLEFDVSFAIAVGGIRAVCLIGHDGCRMVDVASKRKAFVRGLIDSAGWDRAKAEEQFDTNSARCGFVDVSDSVWLEAQRLRETYAGITVAPLVYSLGDGSVRQIVEAGQTTVTARREADEKHGEGPP
ncbi:MAG: carbonic anhydrase [Phycisphaerae bacterium]